MSSDGIRVLRRLAVFPTAVIASCIAAALVEFVAHVFWPDHLPRSGFLLRAISEAAASGVGFVYAGAAMAPGHQRGVAFTLAGVVTCLSMMLTGLAERVSHWELGLIVLGTATAAVLTAGSGSYKRFAYHPPRLQQKKSRTGQ